MSLKDWVRKHPWMGKVPFAAFLLPFPFIVTQAYWGIGLAIQILLTAIQLWFLALDLVADRFDRDTREREAPRRLSPVEQARFLEALQSIRAHHRFACSRKDPKVWDPK